MNNTVNKDILIEILVKENQELKHLLAECKSGYMGYATTLEEVKTRIAHNENTYEEIKLTYEDKVQLLEHLVKAQQKEIEDLNSRSQRIRADPEKQLPKEVVEP